VTTPRPKTQRLRAAPAAVAAAGASFHAEMEQLLRKQLVQQPDVDDVRVKLLELYYEMRRTLDFRRDAQALHRRIADPAGSRDWQRVASMGRMLLPGEPLFASGDRVEFIGAGALGEEPPQCRRFGDAEAHRPLFDELAAQAAPLLAEGRLASELELLLVSLPTRRPTPLLAARRLSQKLGGAQLWLKREDCAADSPHLTAAVAGQALLARRLGRGTLVTATTDGRRGVVAAAIGARLGCKVVVYMDVEHAERAAAPLMHMQLMGARVERVRAGQYHGRDVREAALAHWAQDRAGSFLVMGVDAAPAPYPQLTREFTAAPGRECRRQLLAATQQPPAAVVTRGVRSADAPGFFPAFIADAGTRLVCIEPEPEPEAPAARNAGLSQDERRVAQRILDRLEYPSVAREHAGFRASGRVEYVQTTRAAARDALRAAAAHEGLVVPLESAHALAWACQAAGTLSPAQHLVVVMSEAPDKGVWDVRRLLDEA
jgi:tryptophan synthase beta chain